MDSFEHPIRGTSPTVFIYERADRGYALYARRAHGRSHQRRKLRRVTSVRDTRGRLLQKRIKEATLEALDIFAELDRAEAEEDVARLEPVVEGGRYTLQGLLDTALTVPIGLYATESDHWKDMQRAADRIVRILGANRDPESIRRRNYRTLWRKLAMENVNNGTGGMRAAEMTVGFLARALQWGEDEDLLTDIRRPGKGWTTRLKSDWANVRTQHGLSPQAARGKAIELRHSPAELDRIFDSLDHDDVDPRIALLVDMGGEYRGGQVRRTFRSSLDLRPQRHAPHGRMTVQGSGRKKPGGTLALDEVQRTRIDRVLSVGYLADLEDAYQNGLIDDYPLFPQGRLVRGRAKVAEDLRCVAKKTPRTWFRKLEDVAGVQHIRGRGLHGLRRGLATKAGDVEDGGLDNAAADAMGGWTDGSRARTDFYVKVERERAADRARKSRQRIRRMEDA